jgi:DNA replication protein DnaC
VQHTPPLDPERYNLDPLLAATGRTLDWLNTDNGDPYSEPCVARYSLVEAARITPFHYRGAIATDPELRNWVDQLVTDARREHVQRGSVVPTILRGPSLLLLGSTGVGKTHEAYGAMRHVAMSGVGSRWVVTTAADLYASLRPRHGVDSETEFARYRNARLLLIDDLGAERKPTEFTEEVNFRLINHRYENHLPTLLTSNVLPNELAGRLGDRVTSRLAEMCKRVVLKGTDRRRATGAAA